MKGLLSWASEKLKKRYPLTTLVITKAVAVGRYILNFLRFSEKVKQAKLDFKNGFVNPTTQEIRAFLKDSKKTAKSFVRAQKISLTASAFHLVYSLIVKYFLRNYLNLHWGTEWVLDKTAKACIYKASCFVMGRLNAKNPKVSTIDYVLSEIKDAYCCTLLLTNPEAIGQFIYNFSSATCLNTVSKREANAKYGIFYKPCNCQIIQTPIFAYIHYGVEKLAVSFIRYVLPWGEILSVPIEALVEGKFAMVNKLDGLCNTDQRKIVDRNNWFAIGRGSRYVLPARGITWASRWLFGNTYYGYAIESGSLAFLNHIFILSNNIQSKPYPGKAVDTCNPVEILHVCGEAGLKYVLENSYKIKNLYNKYVTPNVGFTKIEEADVKALETDPTIQIMNNCFLPNDLRLIHTFLCSEAMREYFKEHRKWLDLSIQATIDLVEKFPFTIQEYIPSTVEWIYNNKKMVLHKEELIMLYGVYFLFDRDKQRLLNALSVALNYVLSVQADDRDHTVAPLNPYAFTSKFHTNLERLRQEHQVKKVPQLTRASTEPVACSKNGLFTVTELRRQLSSRVSPALTENTLKTA